MVEGWCRSEHSSWTIIVWGLFGLSPTCRTYWGGHLRWCLHLIGGILSFFWWWSQGGLPWHPLAHMILMQTSHSWANMKRRVTMCVCVCVCMCMCVRACVCACTCTKSSMRSWWGERGNKCQNLHRSSEVWITSLHQILPKGQENTNSFSHMTTLCSICYSLHTQCSTSLPFPTGHTPVPEGGSVLLQ